jgi:predicted nucleic acid-binding Zn ribbon protein
MWVAMPGNGTEAVPYRGTQTMPDPYEPTIADLAALVRTHQRVRKAALRRGPQRIGNVISQVLARRGYAQVQTSQQLATAWFEAAGPLAADTTRVGSCRRGTLEIVVANSAVMQELNFHKQELINQLIARVPGHKIRALRFRAGPIE